MLLQSFIALTLAIAIHWFSRNFKDEAIQIVLTLISRTGLVFSLILAPWSIKLIVVIVLLVRPPCVQSSMTEQFYCSRSCAARSNCPHCP